MRPSSNKILPVLLSLSFVLIFFPDSAGAARTVNGGSKHLIDAACRLASHFDGRFDHEYCVSTLASAQFNDKAKDSLTSLSYVSMNLLLKNATDTKAKIEKMVKSGKFEAKVTTVLQDCISMYDEAVDETTEALELYKKKKYAAADTKVSNIGSDGYECEDAFRAQKLKCPVDKENKDIQYLSGMTSLLIRMFDRTYTPWGTRF